MIHARREVWLSVFRDEKCPCIFYTRDTVKIFHGSRYRAHFSGSPQTGDSVLFPSVETAASPATGVQKPATVQPANGSNSFSPSTRVVCETIQTEDGLQAIETGEPLWTLRSLIEDTPFLAAPVRRAR